MGVQMVRQPFWDTLLLSIISLLRVCFLLKTSWWCIILGAYGILEQFCTCGLCVTRQSITFSRPNFSVSKISQTLAKKHQIYMALYWESFSQCRLTIGQKKMVPFSELRERPEIAAKLNISTNVLSVKWFKVIWHQISPWCISMCGGSWWHANIL